MCNRACLGCVCIFGGFKLHRFQAPLLYCEKHTDTVTNAANVRRLCYRQDELGIIMASLGYTAVVQDRPKSKFTICNVTFFQSSKLCHTWTDSRSRALITGFKLIPDMEMAEEAAATSASTSVGPSASSKAVNGASAVRRAGNNAQEGGMATLAAAVSDTPDRANDGVAGAAEVFIANCHLEGHPWKAQERFNQIKGVLTRMERRQSEAGAPMDDARILVVGVHCNSRTHAPSQHALFLLLVIQCAIILNLIHLSCMFSCTLCVPFFLELHTGRYHLNANSRRQ